MRREMDGTVLARVYCDVCRGEHQPRQGELGQIVVLDDGTPSWYAQDPRRPHPRTGRFHMWSAIVLRQRGDVELDLPDELSGYCRRHGWRRLATADILNAHRVGNARPVLTSWAAT